MSVIVSYKKQVAFGFMLILIILFGLEGLVRGYDFVSPICSIDRDGPYQDYPLRKQICSDMFRVNSYCDPETGFCNVLKPDQHLDTITINDLGFRGDEFEVQKPDNTIRIFVVGGSTVLDLRSPDDKTLTVSLQQNYQSLDISKNIEVINAGNNSFESTQELALIENKILKYSPDMLIIYDGINDVYHPFNWSQDLNISKNQKETVIYPLKNFHAKYFPFYKTVDFFYSFSSNMKNPFANHEFDDSKMEEKVQRWKQNLINICKLGEDNNFKTIVVLQPLLGTGNRELPTLEKEIFTYYDHDKIVPAYEMFAEQLGSIKNECEVLDFRNVFDNVTDNIYFDGQHVSFEANSIIASELFNKTKNSVLDLDN